MARNILYWRNIYIYISWQLHIVFDLDFNQFKLYLSKYFLELAIPSVSFDGLRLLKQQCQLMSAARKKNKSFFNELQCTYQSYSHFIKKYLSNFIVTIFHIWNIMILPLNLSTQCDYFLISFKLDVKYIPVPFDITILLNLVLSMRFSLISLPLFLVVIIQNRETFIYWGCKTHL